VLIHSGDQGHTLGFCTANPGIYDFYCANRGLYRSFNVDQYAADITGRYSGWAWRGFRVGGGGIRRYDDRVTPFPLSGWREPEFETEYVTGYAAGVVTRKHGLECVRHLSRDREALQRSARQAALQKCHRTRVPHRPLRGSAAPLGSEPRD